MDEDTTLLDRDGVASSDSLEFPPTRRRSSSPERTHDPSDPHLYKLGHERDMHAALEDALCDIKACGSYFTFGSLFPAGLVDAGLTVEGVGTVELPLGSHNAERLVRARMQDELVTQPSPVYASDQSKTCGIDKTRVSFGPSWDGSLKAVLKRVHDEMGYGPEITIKPVLEQLLVQQPGDVFDFSANEHYQHTAALAIILPSSYKGGKINVSLQHQTTAFTNEELSCDEYQYIAWDSNVQLQSDLITSGVRLVILYRLELDPSQFQLARLRYSSPGDKEFTRLKNLLSMWERASSSTSHPHFLVYILQHEYHEGEFDSIRLFANARARLNALQDILSDSALFTGFLTGYVRETKARSCASNNSVHLNKRPLEDRCPMQILNAKYGGRCECCTNYGSSEWEEEEAEPEILTLEKIEQLDSSDRRGGIDLQINYGQIMQYKPFTDYVGAKTEGWFRNFSYGIKYCFRKPVVVLMPLRNSGAFRARLWLANLHREDVFEALKSCIERKVPDHLVDITTLSDVVLEFHEIHRSSNVFPRRWQEILLLVVDAARTLKTSDVFRKICHALTDVDSYSYLKSNARLTITSGFVDCFLRLKHLPQWNNWAELNWWVSTQESLQDLIDACDTFIGVVRYRTANKSGSDNAGVFSAENLTLWKASMIRLALVERREPRPTDAGLLAMTSHQLKDNLFTSQIISWITSNLHDANFLFETLDGVFKVRGTIGQAEVELQCKHILVAANALCTGVSCKPLVLDTDLSHDGKNAQMDKIISTGNKLIPECRYEIVSLLKAAKHKMRYIIVFMDKAMRADGWTTPTILDFFGARVLQPAICSMNFTPMNEPWDNRVNTRELKTLLYMLLRLKMRRYLDMAIRRMSTFQDLMVEDFESTLGKKYPFLCMLYDEREPERRKSEQAYQDSLRDWKEKSEQMDREREEKEERERMAELDKLKKEKEMQKEWTARWVRDRQQLC